jgi:glycosyltransferase involved in cell wall biosynthesis
MKSLSDKLQGNPLLWKSALFVYGFRKFNSETIIYSAKKSNFEAFQKNSKKFDLVFDAQCLQTSTRQRGIGTYSLSLVAAICQNNPNDNFAAVLATVAEAEDLNLAYESLTNLNCHNLEIIVFDPFETHQSLKLQEAQTRIKLFLESICSGAVLCLSNFEKVTSAIPIPKSDKYRQVGILYDLIPLQFPDLLLMSKKQKTAYDWALNNLKAFDLLLSISEETKKNWFRYVDSQTKVEVIQGGGFPKQSNNHKDFSERSGVLCVGAEQPHKNIERLISAYSLLPIEIQRQNGLTILGIRSTGARKRLLKRARATTGNVQIPEYLETKDLFCMYEDARLLVMPSIVEGLSLPILEAWSFGLVAVGGFNTVAQELIAAEFLLFDPYDDISMSRKIAEYLTSNDSWTEAQVHSLLQSQVFTWESTSMLARNAIKGITHV